MGRKRLNTELFVFMNGEKVGIFPKKSIARNLKVVV